MKKKDSMRDRNMEKFLSLNHEIFSFNNLLLRVEAQLAKTWGFVYGKVEKEKSNAQVRRRSD